jgi:ABC-type xylose transport system substrate-binding protein
VIRFIKEQWILLFFLLLLIVISLPLIYFGSLFSVLTHAAVNADDFTRDSAPKVGICLNNLLENRWTDEKAVWLKLAREKRIPVQIRIAHNSLQRQIRQVRTLIRQNVKVLILVPVSRTGLSEPLREAAQKRIRIILYDELTEGPADFFCGVDYREMGRVQAAALAKAAGPGNYLLFRGPTNSFKAGRILEGQLDVVKKFAKNQIRLLSLETIDAWSAEQAALKTRTFVTHQKVDAVLTPNDLTGEEIGRFFRSQQMKLPFIAGAGGETAFCQRIGNGENLITLKIDYPGLARTAFLLAEDLLRGDSPATGIRVKYRSREIPVRLLRSFTVIQKGVAGQGEK